MNEILRLHDDRNLPALVEHLKKFNERQLVSFFVESLKTSKDPSVMLSALLSGIGCQTDSDTRSRFEVFVRGLQVVGENVLGTSLVSKIMGVLLLETPGFSNAGLAKLFLKMLELAKPCAYPPGKWLDIISRILSVTSTRNGLPYNDAKLTGEQYKERALKDLCLIKWQPKIVVNIATIFNDIELSSDQLKFVLSTYIEKMRDLPLDCVPPLVFQLHILCAKGHKLLFLKGLMKFFDDKERDLQNVNHSNDIEELVEEETEGCKLTELRSTEGTVMLHLFFAIKSDQDLGHKYVKWLKANRLWPSSILTLFSMSMSFCLANMSSFQKPIFDSLKVAVIQHFMEMLCRKTSHWSRKLISADDSVNVIMESITKSIANWDHVTEGLVEFGFYLLDTLGTIDSHGKTNKDIMTVAKEMACSLGYSIILTNFKFNRSVRRVIVNSILNSIVSTESSATRHYMKLLADTIGHSPRDYQEFIPNVRELLDNSIWLKTAVSTELFCAIQPLLTSNSSFRDSVMLMIRKKIFAKEMTDRKIAINISLICLKNLRSIGRINSQGSLSSSLSSQQFSADVHSVESLSNSDVLSLELLYMLRQCLIQQAELRIQFYLGLPKILKQNPSLTDPVLELLLSQANNVIEAGANPPIRLKRCTQIIGSEVVYMEPLPYLLQCIHNCIPFAKSNESSNARSLDDTLSPWSHPLVSLLEDFRSAVIKTEIEDYELDLLVEFSPLSAGSKNVFFAKLILSVYEALIEYTYFNDGFNTANMTEIMLDLFALHKRLSSVLKEKSTNPKKKKDAAPAAKLPKTTAKTSLKNENHNYDLHFSAKFLTSVLQLVMDDEKPDHQEVAEELKLQTDLIGHMLTIVGEKVSKIQEIGHMENESEGNSDEALNFCCSIGRSIFHKLAENDEDDSGKSANEVALDIKCFECLASIFTAVTTRFPEKLSIFYDSLAKIRPSNTLESTNRERSLGIVVKKLQKLVISVLSDSETKLKHKQLGSLISIITHLVDHMEHNLTHLHGIFEWVENLCQVHSVDDVAIAKSLFQLFFKVAKQFDAYFKSLMSAAEDIHTKMGDIDDTVATTGPAKYALITEMNSSGVFLVLVQCVDSLLSNIDWMISKLKANYELKVKEQNDNTQRVIQLGDSICAAFATVTTCEYYFIQCDMPAGPCEEATIRLMSRSYLTLQELTKYFIALCKVPNYQLPRKFIKLIDTINSKITQQVYSFIEAHSRENEGDEPRPKPKGKSNVAVSKANKESALLPSLVYNIEQYERYLINLAKLSKVNLTSNLKRSTNRDFRIDTAIVRANLENNSNNEQNGDAEEREDIHNTSVRESQVRRTQNVDQPPPKRLKLSDKRNLKAKKLVTNSSQK